MAEDIRMNLLNTMSLLRKYIREVRPQSFASVYGLYKTQKKKCEIFGIRTSDTETADIESYAKKEHIEQFGFEK